MYYTFQKARGNDFESFHYKEITNVSGDKYV
jgi:hypothetical protein